jgi:ubiquitin carboxyl-terminal hydrolase L3
MSRSKCSNSFVENNPEVFTVLAHKLGLSSSLEFVDVYSLTDAALLSHIARPVLGLLAIFPLTPTWDASRKSEDASKTEPYLGSNESDEVLWFEQTIGHACGSIGLIHILLNGPAKKYILPGSTLAKIREEAKPLDMAARAQLLYDSKELEEAHQSVAELGDTIPPSAAEGDRLGQHFVGLVIENGKLWELEGGRKGALDRGAVEEGDDALSAKVVEAGLGRVIAMETAAGGADLRFSVIALVKKTADEAENGVIEGGIGGWQL